MELTGPPMITKADNPLDSLAGVELSAISKAYFEIAHLKHMFRQGWLKREISQSICESVAEHSFGVAMLCLLLLPQRPELDALKVIRFALIHDLGEILLRPPHGPWGGSHRRQSWRVLALSLQVTSGPPQRLNVKTSTSGRAREHGAERRLVHKAGPVQTTKGPERFASAAAGYPYSPLAR